MEEDEQDIYRDCSSYYDFAFGGTIL